MKFFGAAILMFALPLAAFAAAGTIKIDSFVSTGRSTSTAELCGHVEGATGAHQILVVSDPKSKGPGKYVVSTTPQGEICIVVATATGSVEASIIGSSFQGQSAFLQPQKNQE